MSTEPNDGQPDVRASIEDVLRGLGDAESTGQSFFRVFINGSQGDIYVSNGSVSMNVPCNKEVVVPACLVDALRCSSGVSFSATPEG